MKVKVPDKAADAVTAVVEKLVEHWKRRPNAIRSWAEAFGLYAEEHHEFIRQLTKSTLDDPKDDKLLNDVCEIAMVALSSYVDMSAVAAARSTGRAKPAPPGFIKGGFNVHCTRCKRVQAFHQRGKEFLCHGCAKAA